MAESLVWIFVLCALGTLGTLAMVYPFVSEGRRLKALEDESIDCLDRMIAILNGEETEADPGPRHFVDEMVDSEQQRLLNEWKALIAKD